jgi:hypothetical protein
MLAATANIVSTTHTGPLVIPRNSNRRYFFVRMIDAAGTLKLGKGTGELPLDIGMYYEPYVCPSGELEITTTGTYIVIMG